MFVRGDEHDLGLGIHRHVGGGTQAVAAGHLDVEHDQIGLERRHLGERLVAIAGAADHLDILDVREQAGEAIERERLVIHQQHAHRQPPSATPGGTPRRLAPYS